MFLRILKNELKHKKGINVILFIFMVLATIFVASSINNILVVSNATKYCMDKGKVADWYVCSYGEQEKNKINSWAKTNDKITSYSVNEAVTLSNINIVSFDGKEGSEYKMDRTILLQSQWKDNMQVFDKDGNLLDIKDGEIGIAQKELDANGLKVGDNITIKIKDVTKTFRISTVTMDPALGGDYTGMTRFIISNHEFNEIKATKITMNYNFCINTEDKDGVYKDLTKQAFNIFVTIDRDMFESSYMISMLEAGMLIVIGVCLIIIAFLILRFTIVFTLQEDYKEIGIMKAIGIKNMTIKNIYLLKYFVLVVIAAAIGCVISVPISNSMLSSVRETILLEDASTNFGVNILCSILVAIVVMALCYLCANRLKKYSAIEAIRSGSNGERFNKKSKLSLHKHGRMKTPLFLAVNDICSNVKRYVVLLLTFMIGVIMIILPVNTITAFGSKEMAKNFTLDTGADFYMSSDTSDKDDGEDGALELTIDAMTDKVTRIENTLKSKGYDAKVSNTAIYTFSYFGEDEDVTYQFLSMFPIHTDLSYIQLTDGTIPKLENEIGMSEKAMKRMGVKLGDTVYAKINGKKKEFIITASYQNFMQMGQSVILNPKLDLTGITSGDFWYYQCHLNNHKDDKNLIEDLRNTFKDYTIYDMQKAMDVQLGSTVSKIGMIKMLVVILILAVNVLITALMMRIFIMSEKSQLALLLSIGYSKRSVRMIEVLRISIILVVSILLAIFLSTFLNDLVLRPIFGIMGATHMKIQVNPLEVYCIYPILLLVVISFAAYISSGMIKKLNLMEINNQE